MINHLGKFIFRLNISREIQFLFFLDQVSRVESHSPLAWYTQRKDKWWKFCKWGGV
jgi:hypothetical protein